MNIKIEWPNTGHKTEYSIPTEELRQALDTAIRTNPKFWELVRDVAGRYQAELMNAELEKRKAIYRKNTGKTN